MIQKRTKLLLVDNSGAILARCIDTNSKYKNTRIGHTVLVSIIKQKPLANKKKQKFHSVLVQTKAKQSRTDGSSIKFDQNAIVLIQKGEPIANKINTVCPLELKAYKHLKIISLGRRYI